MCTQFEKRLKFWLAISYNTPMQVNPSIFKAYDIRGIYPTDMNEKNMVSIVKGIYTFFVDKVGHNNLTVVLGRDMRVSSPSLFKVAKDTLVEMGAVVIDIGLSSTPTFYFAVSSGKYDAGIQISASHNPKEYTGMKFVIRDGEKLIKIGKSTGITEIADMVANDKFITPVVGGKVIPKEDVLSDDVKTAIASVGEKNLKQYKVVADPANAMGAQYLEELIKYIPVDLVKMNFKLDGTFPVHQPDPLEAKNLLDLQKKVKEEKADLGIAPDGDGDRVFFVDEKGNIIPATLISALVAKEILKQHPGGKIIVDIRYTRNVENIVQKLGGTTSISKVGHALITEKLNSEGAVFAGESSGHFYFAETGGAESSLRVILYVLKAMSETGKPISEIVNEYHTSFESGEYNFILGGNTKAADLLEQFANDYKDGEVIRLDGLAVNYTDWRFGVRTSNTEPLLRLNVEGKSPQIVQQKLKELREKILSSGAKAKE